MFFKSRLTLRYYSKELAFISVLLLTALPGASRATCPVGLVQTKPDNIYTINADNTVTDRQTGLTWDRCTYGRTAADCSVGVSGNYSWPQALAAVQTANSENHLGHNDWRLPNVKELQTLVEVACYWPAINSTVFPRTSWIGYGYWSSTPIRPAFSDVEAWVINFSEGQVDIFEKFANEYLYVRLVRGGV